MQVSYIKITLAVLGFAALSSCDPNNPPILAEPVIVEQTAPPPPIVRPAPEAIIVPQPEPVFEVIVEPSIEEILAGIEDIESAAGPAGDQDEPDEVLSGEITPEEAIVGITIEDGKQKVRVYYGTNRQFLLGEDQSTQGWIADAVYGETPAELRYGTADIIIPPRHKKGRLETPIAGRANNERRYVVLRSFDESGMDAVMGEVQIELARAALRGDEKTLIAYVHGFNTSFEKAARRAGQLKYDLDYTGPFFFFSWPSRESAFGYTHAANLAEISYTAMTEFLKNLTDQDADRIIIIAHSMGTRVFSHGLVDLAQQDPEAAKKITKVVLAAPDIDARVFKERLLPRMSFLEKPITIYASSKDIALEASKKVNGLPRLGDVLDPIVTLPKVVMIDASDVKSNLLNHTYFGDSVSIVDDFKDIVNGPLALEVRPMLIPEKTTDGRKFWRVKPNR